MKLKNLIIMITLLILVVPFISAVEYNYCFNHEDQYSFCNSYTTYKRCGNYNSCTCGPDTCGPICLEYDSSRNCYNQGNPDICNQNGGCLPGGTGGSPNELIPPVITLNSPVQDNLYGSRAVLFDVTFDEKANVYYKDNNDARGSWKKIASMTQTLNKKISLKDGLNDITIKAVDKYGNEATKDVKFYIDSKKPVIRRTYPKQNSYANGEFTVEYKEENVRSISLFINGNKVQTKTDCPSDARSASCTFDVELGPYDGQEIEYNFEISDPINTVGLRRTVKAKVDVTYPEFIITNSPVNGNTYGRSVPFEIGVSELAKVEYMDMSESRPRWRSLCNKCDEYTRTKTFSRGQHTITIQATDPAGNAVGYNVDFNVDY